MEINKKDVEWEVAKAFVNIETALLGMGDCYEETTNWLCEEAGISFDEENYHNIDYYKRVNKKAYYTILKEKNPENILSSNLEYFLDCKEQIFDILIYYKNVTTERHPLIKAIITILEYTIDLHKKGLCSDGTCDIAYKLYKDFTSINLRASNYAHKFSREFYKLLDDNHFNKSNNCFVIGGVQFDEEDERFHCKYVCHAELKNKDNGYTIVFDFNGKDYFVKFYEYEKNFGTHLIENKDINKEYIITKKGNYIGEIVDILNNLVK